MIKFLRDSGGVGSAIALRNPDCLFFSSAPPLVLRRHVLWLVSPAPVCRALRVCWRSRLISVSAGRFSGRWVAAGLSRPNAQDTPGGGDPALRLPNGSAHQNGAGLYQPSRVANARAFPARVPNMALCMLGVALSDDKPARARFSLTAGPSHPFAPSSSPVSSAIPSDIGNEPTC